LDGEKIAMRKKLRFVIGVGLMAAAVGYLIFTAVRNTAEYYLTVNEVAARRTELAGQMIRVAGRVAPNPISWDAGSLTLDFAIAQPPAEVAQPPSAIHDLMVRIPPTFHVMARGQPKPDMFAPGRDVIVEGRLGAGDTIEARQVLTSCPSKYQAKEQ
jgi:cytochrome c-type biogenesis protein CcmE